MPLDTRKFHLFMPLLSIVLFAIAIGVVHHEIEIYHWPEIERALADLTTPVIVQMLALTALGYLVLCFYDYLALEYAGEKLSFRRAALASFLSYAISNNVGHAMISGGSMRFRLYSAWGVPATSIAKVVVFCSLTYIVGALMLFLAGYLAVPDYAGISQTIAPQWLGLSAAFCAVLLALWWGAILFYRKEINVRNFQFSLPKPSMAVRQTIVALGDLVLASLVLYVPLSQGIAMPYGTFLALYIGAQLVGLVSQVPGGIGVFEGSFLLLTANHYPANHILAALMAYRAIYFFLPLMVSALVLAVYELRAHGLLRAAQIESTFRVLRTAVPQIFSVLLLLGGGVLLFSGVTPADPARLKWLDYFLPLTLIEFSHLAGSIAGVMLLFLSRAVAKRMDSAYVATILTLIVGIIVSLIKGWDYEEASILFFMLLLFLPTRAQFYRKSSLLALDMKPSWLVLCSLIIGLSAWLGFFSYKHVEYSGDLWWQFALYGDASRFLRSMLAVAVLGIGFLLYRLITQPIPKENPPGVDVMAQVMPIVQNSGEITSNLAFLGDKRFFFSESGKSFIMYDTTPGYWIAMGDPLGDAREFERLVWRWRERADRYAAKISFYQVGTNYIPIYLDLGLGLIKLGREAHVPLADFSLEGKKGKSLRHAYFKLEREGFQFEILPAIDVPAFMPELKYISDSWMQTKHAKEKRFSLGYFDPDYLSRFDVAVIRKDEKILAFANIWRTSDKHEISIDLMRYLPGTPNGIMEYLFVALMLRAKSEGYTWFNLGMAPLAGLEKHPLAPLWHKIGNTIFRFGNEFYNFEGLYQYKSKFQPVWKPRYLATPPGFKIASALLAVTSLVSSRPDLNLTSEPKGNLP